jgi:ribosomal protein S18 acetylase RimI-like enzyme
MEPNSTDTAAGRGIKTVNYSLRPATEEDYDFLWNLICMTMRGHVDATWGWDEEWQARRFRARFDAAQGHVIVVDGQNAGGLAVTRGASSVTLDYLYILPAFQRQGIGCTIIKSIILEARAMGVPLTLDVLRSNPDARRLYERLGLKVVGENEERFFMSTVAEASDDP